MFTFCPNFFVAGQFLSALLKDGAIDEESLSSQKLDSIYGTMRERVSESIRGQEDLLQKIQVIVSFWNVLFKVLQLLRVNGVHI